MKCTVYKQTKLSSIIFVLRLVNQLQTTGLIDDIPKKRIRISSVILNENNILVPTAVESASISSVQEY